MAAATTGLGWDIAACGLGRDASGGAVAAHVLAMAGARWGRGHAAAAAPAAYASAAATQASRSVALASTAGRGSGVASRAATASPTSKSTWTCGAARSCERDGAGSGSERDRADAHGSAPGPTGRRGGSMPPQARAVSWGRGKEAGEQTLLRRLAAPGPCDHRDAGLEIAPALRERALSRSPTDAPSSTTGWPSATCSGLLGGKGGPCAAVARGVERARAAGGWGAMGRVEPTRIGRLQPSRGLPASCRASKSRLCTWGRSAPPVVGGEFRYSWMERKISSSCI